MDDVDYEDDVRQTQGDELQQPEAEEGDGREKIVADVGTTGLDGVTDEPLLLVPVERVTGEEEDQDSEEDHHNEPHLSYQMTPIIYITLKTDS